MKFCPVQCLQATIQDRTLIESRYEMYKCAEMTQQYEAMPSLLQRLLEEPDPIERQKYLYGPLAQELWYKMAIGEGEMVAQCFECMRVCPVARTAPQADPVKRWKLKQEIPLTPT